MKNDVYLFNCNKYQYINETFRVCDYFKELADNRLEISSDKAIYESIRNLFITMKLDCSNIGTKNWNPFSKFIKNGDTILIKPNLVKHINESIDGSLDSLITNFSIIRPIIDYSILALHNTGRIIIGDSPVQECNFDEMLKINDLGNNITKYKTLFSNIEIVDFRMKNNSKINCKLVKINKQSSFCELDDIKCEYSITNYDLNMMKRHHQKGLHEYLIPDIVLKSNVIFNLAKPKTHRKAGMTACMKNFVGINGSKECLPHHRTGSKFDNGDEYPEKSIIKFVDSYFKKLSYKNSQVVRFLRLPFAAFMKLNDYSLYQEGSWYGNDTIWRTILDLNKLIVYSNANGQIMKNQQRTIFNLTDMIVSGEGEGPLLPSDKKVGYIVCGFNQLNVDYVICHMMGFDYKKIKYIDNGYKLKELLLSNSKKFKLYDTGYEIDIAKIHNFNFKPTNGWKKKIEINKNLKDRNEYHE